ncbi:MAG: hypothetical protein K2O15_02705 [Lachnospiraceae bacterium]|nr:hypothetical protein [Lachnospiraceae bacterium]
MEIKKMAVSKVSISRIEVNDDGEYIAISADDTSMFDRFAAGILHIAQVSDGTAKKIEEIEKQYEGQEGFEADMGRVTALAGVNVDFSEDAVKTIDGIFGQDTVKKVFRDTYKEIPDFMPSVSLITDFLEQITPYMEKLFNRKLDVQKKASKERMARYKPQDHKKPSAKK